MAKVAGKLGLSKESHLPSVEITNHRAGAVNPGDAAPTESDWSGGIPDHVLGMLGNAEYSNCGPAGTEHGRMFKAFNHIIKSHAASGAISWSPGFRPPHEAYTLWLYSQYLKSMGETLAEDPGVENSSWLLFMYNLTKTDPGTDTLAFAEWPLSTDPNQLVLDAVALRGMLTAVALDAQYATEFQDDQPFGTLSTIPDQNYGHDMWWSGVSPGFENYCTWSTNHLATDPWVANCVLERWGTLTHEDADRIGANWDSLTATLNSETDAHPALSQVDFSKFARETFLQNMEMHVAEIWKHV